MSVDSKNQRLSSEKQHDEEMQPLSKSQIKRDLQKLKVIGSRLLELKPEQIPCLPASERFQLAIEEGLRIKSFNARKRHLGFIAKLIQNEPLEGIQEFIDAIDGKSKAYNLRFHQLEQWRNRLIAGDSRVMAEIIEQFPEVDRQHINQLVRNAVKEQNLEKSPVSSRKLFRYLKDMTEL